MYVFIYIYMSVCLCVCRVPPPWNLPFWYPPASPSPEDFFRYPPQLHPRPSAADMPRSLALFSCSNPRLPFDLSPFPLKFQKHSTAGKTHCSNWFAGTPPGVPGDTLGSYEELRWMESPCLELLFSKIRCTQTQTQTPLAGGSPWNWMQWPPRLSTMSCGHGQAVPYLKFKHSSYHITHPAYVGKAELIHDGWLMTNGGAWALLLPSTLGL